MHFLVTDKGTMHTHRQPGATGHVKHIAHAQQGFSAHLVQNGATVDFARHLKRDSGRNIGLDQAGDHIHAGALRSQNEVNAGSTGFLGEPGNQFLDLFTHHHHQVGQFIDHDNNVRQPIQRLGRLGREAERVANMLATGLGFVELDVVARQVAHTHLAHELVTALHFSHAPGETVSGLLHVRHDRRQQMRNALVHRHLQHFGVDHQQAHVARLGLVQQAQNHGVDADRLARPGGARHQDMGHLGQIGHHRITDDVLAQTHGQHGPGLVVNIGAKNL